MRKLASTQDILRYLDERMVGARMGEIEKRFGYAEGTVKPRMRPLIERGLVKMMYVGRSTRYYLPAQEAQVLAHIERSYSTHPAAVRHRLRYAGLRARRREAEANMLADDTHDDMPVCRMWRDARDVPMPECRAPRSVWDLADVEAS